MPREKEAYRDNLEQILQFTKNKHLLSRVEAGEFLGIDKRTAEKKYSFKDGYISAATLARELS